MKLEIQRVIFDTDEKLNSFLDRHQAGIHSVQHLSDLYDSQKDIMAGVISGSLWIIVWKRSDDTGG